MRAFEVAGRCISAAAGLLLCYGALFLYEDEQRVVQSTLEGLWIKVDDLRIATVRRHLAFLRVAAAAALKVLDRLFGDSLLSVRAVSAAACISVTSLVLGSNVGFRLMIHLLETRTLTADVPGSLLVAGAELSFLFGEPLLAGQLEPVNFAAYGIALVGVLALVAQFVSERSNDVPLFVVLAFLILLAVATAHASVLTMLAPLAAAIALLVGILCDLAAVAVLRVILRRQLQALSVAGIVATGIVEVLLGVVLVIVPLYSAFLLLRATLQAHTLPLAYLGFASAEGALFALNSNVGSVALTLLHIASVASLALHRIFWPFLARPLYQLAQLRLFASWRTRTAVFFLGITLLITASSGTAEVLGALWSLVTSA